jgi:hypothetical protein
MLRTVLAAALAAEVAVLTVLAALEPPFPVGVRNNFKGVIT